MGELPLRCSAVKTLSEPVHDLLERIPCPAHVVNRVALCRLEEGHDGWHIDLGQQSGDNSWWVQWSDDGGTSLSLIDPCSATQPIDDPTSIETEDWCLLQAGHVGRHDYEFDRNSADELAGKETNALEYEPDDVVVARELRRALDDVEHVGSSLRAVTYGSTPDPRDEYRATLMTYAIRALREVLAVTQQTSDAADPTDMRRLADR